MKYSIKTQLISNYYNAMSRRVKLYYNIKKNLIDTIEKLALRHID